LQLGILMLVRVQDIGVVPQQKFGNRGHQTFLVGAGNQQDGGMSHGRLRKDLTNHNQQRGQYADQVFTNF